jgi:hypothetical protein
MISVYSLIVLTYYIVHFVNLNSVALTAVSFLSFIFYFILYLFLYLFFFFLSNVQIAAIIFGGAQAMFGMHILHDASHCGVTHSPTGTSFLFATELFRFIYFLFLFFFLFLLKHGDILEFVLISLLVAPFLHGSTNTPLVIICTPMFVAQIQILVFFLFCLLGRKVL